MRKNLKIKSKSIKPIVVAVSGGFDPPHIGHLKLFREARGLGDQLVVILNNDNWLRAKKGYIFMPEKERKAVVGAIKWVDRVVLSRHGKSAKDMSVSAELKRLRPHIFANGGDRYKKNVPEVAACRDIQCRMVFGVGGGKVQSSSRLLENYAGKLSRRAKNSPREV